MSYMPYKPDKLFILADALKYPAVEKIKSNLKELEPVIINDLSQVQTLPNSCPLTIAKQKSQFFKRCPGTRNYICCGYKILNLVNNCELNCSYCVLQGYFSNSNIIVYANIEDMFAELEELFKSYPNHLFRIGTGELADSLSTDHITEFSKLLVPFFSDKKNAIIELKTKTTQIENFYQLPHGVRTVVSWSLNTPSIIMTEESSAPTLEERLIAAQQCQKAGFKIGFHFDPMIYYQNWEPEYKSVVDKIFQYVDPQRIIWISLGALRYPAHLDAIIRSRHSQSNIVYGELLPGLDGKLRYFKPLRIDMFNKMFRWIKSYDENIFIYLCMESSEVWQKAFGWSPQNNGSLSKMMDKLIE